MELKTGATCFFSEPDTFFAKKYMAVSANKRYLESGMNGCKMVFSLKASIICFLNSTGYY